MRAPTRTPEGQLIRSILNETSELTQPHLPIDPGLVGDLLNGILGDKIELIAQSRQEALSGFNNRLRERWESPLNKLEFLLILSSEIGSYTFIERLPEKEQNLDPRYHAMNELHSRAIQVGYEIITLLSNGHADGALARWRSLHETAVYSHFILKSDPSIGSRFIDYKLLEQIQLIEENEKHSGDSIDTDLREEYDQLKQLLVEKYGKPFDDGGYGYGWAAEEFDNKSASFRRIEEKSGLDIYHPAYVLANNNVHSGSIGSQWHIGVMDTDNRDLPNVTG
ncbi:DUF5677 domain-containing protein, partial [Halorubrum sp. Atlit-26R]|uniref:DUF5677 domain-containing protein n=1 Tax=Halorubrum sp. Atlit-26R TaxID=2282128 RepID=UPI001F3272A6